MSLEVQQLTKKYKKKKALDAISFLAAPGQVLGFLGPNGAGKSTTMKIASGFLLPDEGDVRINGLSVLAQPREVSRILGYLPEHNPLYLDMYVKEFLEFVANLYRLKGKAARIRIERMIDQCGLGEEQHKKIGALSKGYRQRVGLARALVHDPRVVILDEPTTGLDPNQLLEIRKLIRELGKDKTMVLSTHILQEVEAICDKVVIIHKGKIVAEDLLSRLKSAKGLTSLYLETAQALEMAWFRHFDSIHEIHDLGSGQLEFLTFEVDQARNDILRVVQEKGLSLLSIRQRENNLESIFQQLTLS